jgi:coatomer subunit beta'
MISDIRTVASTTSDRVKSVAFHPTESLLAVALFNGTVVLFNTNDFSVLRTIRVDAERPIRSVRWIPAINGLIAAGDNGTISCFDYTTGTLIVSKPEAHTDFIRQIAVHPTQAQFVSCSDDFRIKSYTISKDTINVINTYEGHTHYVMDVKFNPTDDGTTFVTASLDCTIKFWDLTTQTVRFTLNGHTKGVNCIEFLQGTEKSLLASGSDDLSIKIWDYHAMTCVVTLSGHSSNVTALKFHTGYHMLMSTGEDEILQFWNALSFKQETMLSHQKRRGWCIDSKKNLVAVGYDEGLVIVKTGGDSSQR